MMYPWRSLSSSTSLSSSSSFASKEVCENQVMTVVDMREQIRRERETERIRAEIMVEEEMQRRRQLGGWMGLSSSSVMLRPEVISLGGYENRPFNNDIIYGRSVVLMPTVPEIYSHGGGGSHRREGVDDEPPFQRAPRFREMDVYPTTNDDDGKTEIVGKGKPCEATSSKRKEPPQPSPPSRAGSIGFGLDSSTTTKKLKGEWSCDVCKISATSKNGLNEHLAGKKHQTKMAALKSPNNGGSEIGLGKVKSSVKEQYSMEISVTPKENRETKGESAKKRFNPWCRICKVKTTSEQNMKKHRQGKQHLKKRFIRQRAKNKTRLAGSKSIGAQSNKTYYTVETRDR